MILLPFVLLVMLAMFVNPNPAIAIWNGGIDGLVWIVDVLIAWTE